MVLFKDLRETDLAEFGEFSESFTPEGYPSHTIEVWDAAGDNFIIAIDFYLKNGGRTAFIKNIGEISEVSGMVGGGVPNSFGIANTRNLFRFLKKKFPTVQQFEFERVTGARGARGNFGTLDVSKL